MKTNNAADWECTNDEYHADTTKIGHSQLERFRRSPRKFHALYIEQSLPRPEPSEAMVIGTLFHMYVLEPWLWDKQIVTIPKIDRRTKAGKESYEAFEQRRIEQKLTLAETKHVALVKAMDAALMANPLANKIITSAGAVEKAIHWKDEAGLTCKCKFDKLLPECIINLKTARDVSPAEFGRSLVNFGYHRQAALYQDGYFVRYGKEATHVFLCVSTEPPHEVACYEVDIEGEELGRQQNRRDLDCLAATMQSGDWCCPHEREINPISLPKWAFNELTEAAL